MLVFVKLVKCVKCVFLCFLSLPFCSLFSLLISLSLCFIFSPSFSHTFSPSSSVTLLFFYSACLFSSLGAAIAFCLFVSLSRTLDSSFHFTIAAFLSLSRFLPPPLSLSSKYPLTFCGPQSFKFVFDCFPLSVSHLSFSPVDDNINICREFHDQRVCDE